MKHRKTFKTLDEQIKILKEKNLIIKDDLRVKEILYRENYFFINGYRHLFMTSYNDTSFIKGTTFDELYGTFLFDRNVRNIMFKYLLTVENNIKSIMSHNLSQKYGYKEKEYLNPKNYAQDAIKVRQIYDVLNKVKRQIRINGKQHKATAHYSERYCYVPMWIVVKVLSFGIISEMYNILKFEDQIQIAEHYNLTPDNLSVYLAVLANFRNLCAHEDILYDHRTQRGIADTKYHYLLDIEKTDDEYNYGKNDLFAVMIIMKQLLTEEEFKGLLFEVGYEIDILDGKIEIVSLELILNKIGFPSNWREIGNVK